MKKSEEAPVRFKLFAVMGEMFAIYDEVKNTFEVRERSYVQKYITAGVQILGVTNTLTGFTFSKKYCVPMSDQPTLRDDLPLRNRVLYECVFIDGYMEEVFSMPNQTA